MRRRFGKVPLQLLRDNRNGAERRAQFMGRRRRKTVNGGQMMLPLQDQFGRRQGIGQLAGLFSHLEGINPMKIRVETSASQTPAE